MAPKSKKNPLLKVIPCHYWGKFSMKNTGFTLESSHKLLVELQSKKSDHSVKSQLKVYNSGFKLKRRGHLFTDKLLYITIIRYFVFKSEPHLVFMGVERKKKRFFYALLFRNLEEVNEVCDLIEKEKIARIPQYTEEVAICPMPQQQQQQALPIQTTTEIQSEPIEEKIVYVEAKVDECEVKREKAPYVKSTVEYHYDERHTNDMGTTTVDALLVRTNRKVSSAEWNEDMRYLEYNPQLGTTYETEAGPIYMYTAHFTPAEYKNFGTCESDSSDEGESWDVNSRGSSSDNTTGMVMKKQDGNTVVMAHRCSDAGFR